MLQLNVELTPECWDEKTESFIEPKVQTLQLEHSLVSISKWEAKWKKPFLSKDEKTDEETIDYIRCMTITQNVNPDVYNHLSIKNIEDVNKYMQAPMTATWFNGEKRNGRRSAEQVTNEIIYYWMITLNIPVKFEKWHLNRLLTLIHVCNVKNDQNNPNNKLSKRDITRNNAALNAARKARLKTKG